MANKTLHNAMKAKNDEFYTQIYDIENELRHYRDLFRGKTILCNCDDPYESNFFKYFALNFNFFGLKKLICTCYAGSAVMGTELGVWLNRDTNNLTFLPPENDPAPARKPYKVVITEIPGRSETDKGYDLTNIEYLLKNKKNVMTLLEGDGDFRSEECIELLKEADIVATNPPFSLFREYVAQLIKYDKKFIIIGNQNAITYKEIFPLIKDNKVWLGYNSGDMSFTVPDYYEEKATRFWIDEEGRKWRSMGNIAWYTNMDVKKRHEDIILYKKYTPEEFPKYDNYNAINVDKTSDIPEDYDGVMGVPITFLDKYNPEQFEIVGLGNARENFTPTKDYINPVIHYKDGKTGNGDILNRVLAIEQDAPPINKTYYTSDNSKYLVAPYARVLIRRKQQAQEISN